MLSALHSTHVMLQYPLVGECDASRNGTPSCHLAGSLTVCIASQPTRLKCGLTDGKKADDTHHEQGDGAERALLLPRAVLAFGQADGG